MIKLAYLLPLSLVTIFFQSTAAAQADPLDRPAMMTPRATSAVLLDVQSAGNLLVAVGERGTVLISDDAGKHWRQGETPVSVTLTAVCFVDALQGWAVGHAGVVLHTADGGKTWVRQLDGRTAANLALQSASDPDVVASANSTGARAEAERLVADGPDKPFLAVHFSDVRSGFVVGAFGLIFGTEDGGTTWTPWLGRTDNPKGLHLNALAVRGQAILVVGEQGLLLHSVDGGRHFARLESPSEGSWFAAAALEFRGRWMIGGLRGKAYIYDDTSGTFTVAQMAIPVTISSLAVLKDGRVVALNEAGQVQVSHDDGHSFKLSQVPPGAPMSGVVSLPGGNLFASSMRGIRSLPSLP